MRLPLLEFEDFLRGGIHCVNWIDLTRQFLTNVHNFFLYQAGEREADSRRPAGLRATIEVTLDADSLRAGEAIRGSAIVTNSGTATWLPSQLLYGGVSLGCHLHTGNGDLINLDYSWTALGHEQNLRPGERVSVDFSLPPLDAGDYILTFDAVANHITWFEQAGSPTVRKPVSVR